MKLYILTLALLSCAPLLGMEAVKSSTPAASTQISELALKAFKEGNAKTFQLYVKQRQWMEWKFDINHQYPQHNGETLLAYMCKSKPAEMSDTDYETCLRCVLDQPGLDLSPDSKYGLIALLCAIRKHDTALCILRALKLDQTSAFLGACCEAAFKGTLLDSTFKDELKHINAQDTILQMTPFMWAAARGNLPLAQQLVTLGADVTKKDRFGYTALHFAVLNEHPEMAKYILSVNPDTRTVTNNNGRTPVDIVICAKGSDETLDALELPGDKKYIATLKKANS